jgi:ABC-type transport system involved in Fe-S cluster assembly fused permease/ATPase subunit
MLYNEESMNKIIIVYYLSMAFPVTTIVTMWLYKSLWVSLTISTVHGDINPRYVFDASHSLFLMRLKNLT